MPYRGQFTVDSFGGPRWELALELLERGDAVVIDDVSVALDVDAVVGTVASAWQDPAGISAAAAAADLDRANAAIARAAVESEAFRRAIEGRRTEARLIVDYELGAVLIARSDERDRCWADGRRLTVD